MLNLNQVYHGDCLEVMNDIDDKSIDMILCDLPYGTTACKWDVIIPFEPLWEHYKRIIKDNGAIVLTATEPFASYLRMSNIKWYKYDWYWVKTKPTGFQHAKNKPLTKVEEIIIFSKAPMGHKSLLGNNRMRYNPQNLVSYGKKIKGAKNKFGGTIGKRPSQKEEYIAEFTCYPNNVLEYASEYSNIHPTQKPVALFEYLIETYTNKNDLVLDNCAGSGTTGIAARNLNRDFILIEKELEYVEIIKERLNEPYQKQLLT